MSMSSAARAWVVDRFGLGPIHDKVVDRRVTKSPWYFGDGATLGLLFTVLVVTGVLMTFTYAPSPEAAYRSVRYLTERQPLGWFVRALHYWSAGAMVLTLVFHTLRHVLHGGYKAPREGTWLVGVLIFFAVLVMSFTGYVLRWDERALYALRVSLYMFERVPLIGHELVLIVQGDEQMGPQSLTRLYSVHAIVTPLFLVATIAFHVYLVILHGITSPLERHAPVASADQQRELYEVQKESARHGEPFYPDTMLFSGLLGGAVLTVAVALALFVGPPPLYPEANLVRPSFPAEEWWFWWYSALIAVAPGWLAPSLVVLLPLGLFVIMVLLPFVDRGPARGARNRPFAVAAVLLIVLGLAGLSGLRLRSPWTAWPVAEPPAVPEGVVLSPSAEEGRWLFSRYGCNSCHAVAGDGRQVAVDLARTERRWSRDDYRRYILDPPEDISMPPYRGRLTSEELERLLDFVHAAQTFPGASGAK